MENNSDNNNDDDVVKSLFEFENWLLVVLTWAAYQGLNVGTSLGLNAESIQEYIKMTRHLGISRTQSHHLSALSPQGFRDSDTGREATAALSYAIVFGRSSGLCVKGSDGQWKWNHVLHSCVRNGEVDIEVFEDFVENAGAKSRMDELQRHLAGINMAQGDIEALKEDARKQGKMFRGHFATARGSKGGGGGGPRRLERQPEDEDDYYDYDYDYDDEELAHNLGTSDELASLVYDDDMLATLDAQTRHAALDQMDQAQGRVWHVIARKPQGWVSRNCGGSGDGREQV